MFNETLLSKLVLEVTYDMQQEPCSRYDDAHCHEDEGLGFRTFTMRVNVV